VVVWTLPFGLFCLLRQKPMALYDYVEIYFIIILLVKRVKKEYFLDLHK